MLLLSLVIAAAGVVISLRTGSEQYFLVASIPTAILIVTGGMKVRQGLLTGENRLLLPGGERTITAEVLGVTRNLRTAGEKTAYYIVCKFKDPLTGKEETYSSRPLAEYPGKEVIGRKVTVHLDPLEKGKYTVEIDALLNEIGRERAEKAKPAADKAEVDNATADKSAADNAAADNAAADKAAADNAAADKAAVDKAAADKPAADNATADKAAADKAAADNAVAVQTEDGHGEPA